MRKIIIIITIVAVSFISFGIGYLLHENKGFFNSSSVESCGDYINQEGPIIDYPDTYGSVSALEDSSDAVFVGRVLNCGNSSPESDSLDYLVKITDVEKGADKSGQVIVNFSIKTDGNKRLIPFGVHEIFPGQDILVFANKRDGRYYPHGGGSAVAVKNMHDDSYNLLEDSGLFSKHKIKLSDL